MTNLKAVSLIILILISGAAFSQTFTFKINTDSLRKPISPFIYGTNQDYDHAGSKRLGGNRLTGYNWENNASNAGIDYINESDDYEVGDQGVAISDATSPAAVINYFHQKSLNMKAYSLVTLPMAGYVAKDISGPVSAAQIAPSSRWAYVKLHKSSPLSLTPNVADDSVYLDEELNFLINKFGKSNTSTGIKGYSLDNEPDIWYSTHPLLFGSNKLKVSYLMSQSIKTANLIKDMDPQAEVFGWASYGFNGYKSLQDAPDWPSLQGNYQTFLEYYLDKMKEQELLTGRRILDVLDLHWYPETDVTLNVSPFDDKTDYVSNKLRMNMVRSLWDSNYVENTWIGNGNQSLILPVIPSLHNYINRHYPGTKLAISEYSYMGMNHVSGGIAQADALGIFGKNDMYFATYWGYVQKYLKAGFDIYRNYDGKGSTFGDVSVFAKTNNDEFSSVYAAAESSDPGKLHIIALNKDQDSAHLTTISIAGHINYNSAFVYMFDNNSFQIKRLNNIKKINNNTFQVLLPPISAYHFIITTEDLSLYPYIDTLRQNITAGFADGKTVLHIEAAISDGDNNIKTVALDLSALGGNASQNFTLNGNKYMLDYTIPAGVAIGLKNLHFLVLDSSGNTASSDLSFRVIVQLPSKTLWDGDVVTGGENYVYYDNADTKKSLIKMEVLPSGGNKGPANLHMFMIHDPYKWNQFCFRFAPNAFHVDDISNYAFLEFYIKCNAPESADIDISLQDASSNQNNSAIVCLKGNNYISSFNGNSYSRVRIPLTDLAGGTPFDLTKVWQINFHSNTAQMGFDAWIDDIKAVSYSLPSATPVFTNLIISPKAGYADTTAMVTIKANASDPDNNLKEVKADLSLLGGKNDQILNYDGNFFSYTYTMPSFLLKGKKNITVYAVDSTGNEKDSVLNFTVYSKSTTDTIWNGDNYNYGSAWVSNIKTSCKDSASGGNFGPHQMKIHLQPYQADTWGGIVWDWNTGSNDQNIRDMSDKKYFSFYVRVINAPNNFDLKLKLKDVNAEESQPILLKAGNFISAYTGQYQLIKVPVDLLFSQTIINPKKVSMIVLTANSLPASGVDLSVDDITSSGSTVANAVISAQDANCGRNGKIKVDTLGINVNNKNYFINNLANNSGLTNPVFSSLAPGTYDIKITGDNDFVFIQSQVLRGSDSLLVNTTINNGRDINSSAIGGSGRYGYSWSSGQKTPNITNLNNGNYTVTVSDSITGCKTLKTVTIVTTLPVIISGFTAALNNNAVELNWSTSIEQNLSQYEVQRALNNGNFETLAIINADEKYNGSKYQIFDKNIIPDQLYLYRIAVVEKDGNRYYSTTKKIKTQSIFNVNVFPNPTTGKASIILKGFKGITNYSISALNGTLIKSGRKMINDEGIIDVNLSGLSKGTYLITINSGTNRIIKKVILE